jgi:superfamily II DNA or RNA helicase
MRIIDTTRLKRQLEIRDAWILAKACGTVEAATGFGKSYLAILCLLRMLEKDPDRSCIIVVPTIPLKDQWEEELKEHKIKNAKVLVINTLVLRNTVLKADLLILDEIHRYASGEFVKLFDLVDYRWILGLTATLNRLDGKHTLLEAKAPVIATVSQEEAKKSGYISQFKEYNLGVELEKADRVKLDELNKQFHFYFGKFGHDFNVAMYCTTKKGSEGYALEHGLEAKKVAMEANRFNFYMRQRKEFLYKALCKLKITKEILQKFPLKTVTFSESTDFADNLTNILGSSATCYHSKLTTQVRYKGLIIAKAEKVDGKVKFRLLADDQLYDYKTIKSKFPSCKKVGTKELKREAIQSFADNRTKISVINTAKALDQGFNVEDIELAIITSSTTNPTQHIQRVGRAVRRYTYKDGTVKIPYIVNVYIKDSQDEKWLKARQTNPKTRKPLNPDVQWISSVDQIGS